MKLWKRLNVWPGFSEATKDNPVRELTQKAVGLVQAKDRALDLGPGAMNESRFLIEQGFKSVIAVNKDPLESDPVAQNRAAQFPKDRFEHRTSTFDTFDFEPDTYDLINAQRSLPFNPPESFDRMFSSLLASLKQGGILTGNFFGVEHTWKDNRAMTFMTRERAEELLKECEIVLFEEHKRPGETHSNEFDFIVRKK